MGIAEKTSDLSSAALTGIMIGSVVAYINEKAAPSSEAKRGYSTLTIIIRLTADKYSSTVLIIRYIKFNSHHRKL